MGLRMRRRSVCVALTIAACVSQACSSEPDFDLIVRGGTVYDGTGEVGGVKRADVGIKGNRIRAIGDLGQRNAPVVIDASGKVVSPGLIDLAGPSDPTSRLRQGVTTEIRPLDSMGVSDYFAKLESAGTAINVGVMVPLSLARAAGDSTASIDAAMRDGALGVVDDVNASVTELVAAATVAGRYNGMAMLNVESPAAMDDGALLMVGSQAHRIIISGWSRLPSTDAVSDLIRRSTRMGQQNVSVFGALAPPVPPVDTGDVVTREALKYGSMLIDTRTPAVNATLELREAIRRGTSVPASIFDLPQRGIIRENYFADLVVFDETAPAIDDLIVNGVVVVTPKGLTGAKPGTRLVHRTEPR